MRRRLTGILLAGLAVAVLATAGIVTNFVLLGYADSRDDPVGKLSPRADITRPAPSTTDESKDPETDLEEPDD